MDVFYGASSPASARVYVRAPDAGPDAALTGSVRGPFSRLGRTLAVTVSLRTASTGAGLLAQADVPDPCFWSPETPVRYRVQAELRRGGEVAAACDQRLGLRTLGVRGRFLRWEGRRWTLRGVHYTEPQPPDWAPWREELATLVAERPSDELCDEASDWGVPIAAIVAGLSGETLAAELRRLARHAAVLGAVLDADEAPAAALQAAAPNLLLFQQAPRGAAWRAAAWAAAWWAAADEAAEFLARAAATPLPVIAERRAAGADFASARAACDRLQRDLAAGGGAAGGDAAGYVA